MKLILLFIGLCPTLLLAQNIPSGAKVIVVKEVSFTDACVKLLDYGYAIDKKDNDLQTARTEARDFPKYWNATYIINVRVKPDGLYVSGTVTAPPAGGLFTNEPIENQTNRKGETQAKSMFGYPFLLLNEFAKSFNKEVKYLKQ